MFTMPRGPGATLARALCQLALDRNADAFEEIRPADAGHDGHAHRHRPAAQVRRRRLRHRARRPVVHPDRRGAAHLARAATRSSTRPTCRCGSWPTRRATGARPARPAATPAGMLRVHEFDKVEILAYATPEQAPGDARRAARPGPRRPIAALGLPYRILEICTGDLGQSHHRTFDIEVYAPGVRRSGSRSRRSSWFSDYQARRANIRYRPAGREGHRASCTRSTARPSPCPGCGRRSSRPTASPTAAIAIPEVLWPYLRGHREIPVPADAGRRGGLMGLADRRSDYDCGHPRAAPTWTTTRSRSGGSGTTRPWPPGRSSPTPCPSPRWPTTAAPTRGSCWPAASTGGGSSSSPTRLGQGRSSWRRDPGRAATFAWLELHRQVRLRGPSSRWRPGRPTPTSPAAPARPASGRGPRRSRRVLTDRAELDAAVAAAEARFAGRRRPPPALLGWLAHRPRRRSSSGRAGRAASTTASATAGTRSRAPGSSSASRPERRAGRLPTGSGQPGGRGGHERVDHGLRVRVEARALPVPEERAGAAHPRRQLELHAAPADQVDRVAGVQAAQLGRDGLEVGDDLVRRQAAAQVVAEVLGQRAVAAADEQRGPPAVAGRSRGR